MKENKIFVYAIEPLNNGHYAVNAATSENGIVTCHDLAGFMGSWRVRSDGEEL